MKRTLLIVLLLSLLQVQASGRIEWHTSMESAQQAARESGKPIFMNCFVRWAGPSVLMDSVVLHDPLLEEWVPQHFVPLRMEMQSPEGRTLAERYGVTSYAHFLVLTAEGELQHRICGGSKAQAFKGLLTEALSPATSLRGSRQRVESGHATTQDTLHYLHALRTASDGETFRRVGQDFALRQSPEAYLEPLYWECAALVMQYRSTHLDYLLEHRADFDRAHGAEAVDRLLESALCRHVRPWAEGKIQLIASRSDLDQLLATIQSAQLADTTATRLLADLALLRTEGHFQQCLKLMDDRGHLLHRYPGVRSALELTFTFPGMTQADSVALIDYLDRAAHREQGRAAQQLADMRDALRLGQHQEQTGITFREVPFQTAQAQAAKEGKLIFMDCMTSWCGPCRAMARNVFTLPRVGEYFDQRFVSLKMDMESGEGPDLSRHYKIAAYPTMLILRPDGTEVGRIVGFRQADALLEQIEELTQP